MTDITRRNLGKLTVGIAATGAASTFTGASSRAQEAPNVTTSLSRPAEIPASRGPRAVVVGGGWAGLTICRELKRLNTRLQVVLIEKREIFVSHPLSNLWLGGLIPLKTLTHSFLDAAVSGKYQYFNATMIDLDRTNRRVTTDQGYIVYDYLVIAPGVDYDYGAMGVRDAEQVQMLRTRYPAAFVSGSEHITLKRKIKEFKKGIFLLTAPPGIYRCAASPYERACIIAAHFKKNKIPGKVVLVDPRDAPAVNAQGFQAAFDDLYSDHLEYITSTVVQGADPVKKTLATDFDEIKYEDGAIYPRTRASRIIEAFGLAQPRNSQKEANIDHFNYNIIGDERVYVAGDCRPMPFSKSASVAISEGRHVAKVITARIVDKSVAWQTPMSICYSMVDPVGKKAILSVSFYRFDRPSGQWSFASNSKSHNDRSDELGRRNLSWGDEQFRVLFS